MKPTFKSVSLATLTGLFSHYSIAFLLSYLLASAFGYPADGGIFSVAAFATVIFSVWYLLLPLAVVLAFVSIRVTTTTARACSLALVLNLLVPVLLAQVMGA